jgi:hypothetical protein
MRRQDTRIRRRFKMWHWIVALALVLFVLFHISGSYKLKKRLQVLRAQGYPVTLEELDNSYNIPQGAENAAGVYLAAFSDYVEWDREARRGLPVIGKASLPARTQPLDASSRQLVEKFLSENEKTLSLLHEATSIEHCRYPIDLTQGSDHAALWLEDSRASAKLLCLEVLIQCENRDPGKALESIRANLALAGSIGAPLLAHRLTHIGVQAYAYRNIERVVNRFQLTDEQLRTLTEWVTVSDASEGYKRAMTGERCLGLHVFQAPIRDAADQTGFGRGFLLFLAPWKVLGLHYGDALGYINLMQDSIDAVDLPESERLAAFAAVQEDVHDGRRGGMLTRMLWPALARTLHIDIRWLAHSRATRTALALERYRLAEGHLPQSLDNLAPAYTETVPGDPFDGQDMKYRALETGFVVYSVGDDLTDDGGAERGKGQRGPRGKPAPWDITFIVER